MYQIRLSDKYWAERLEAAVVGQEIQQRVCVTTKICLAWLRGDSFEETYEALSPTTEEMNDAMNIVKGLGRVAQAMGRRR